MSLIVAHMLTVFWEGQPNADTELRTPLLVTEGVLLLMLVIDMCMCVPTQGWFRGGG